MRCVNFYQLPQLPQWLSESGYYPVAESVASLQGPELTYSVPSIFGILLPFLGILYHPFYNLPTTFLDLLY